MLLFFSVNALKNYFSYDLIRTEISPYLGSQSTHGSNFKSDKICIKLFTFGFGYLTLITQAFVSSTKRFGVVRFGL